jgi:phosphoglycolate phosphatase
MKRQFILFDFDGVIADSFEAAYRTIRSFHPEIQEEEYRAAFSSNIFEYGKEKREAHGAGAHSHEEWREVHGPLFEKHAKPFAEMPSIVRTLAERYVLAIISSSNNETIRSFLERENLLSSISRILGAEVHMLKHTKIEMVFEEFGATPATSIFVTDSVGDIREAHLAQVASIAVSWGFQKREVLAEAKPFRLVEKPTDLIPAIESFFNTPYAR